MLKMFHVTTVSELHSSVHSCSLPVAQIDSTAASSAKNVDLDTVSLRLRPASRSRSPTLPGYRTPVSLVAQHTCTS